MDKENINRILLIGAAISAIIIFNSLDLGKYLTLDYLKESHSRFQELYLNNRALVIASYMGIYIVVTALSLPGAAVMTLAGGGLFGFVTGSIVVSFASTIGATLACLVSRFLLQDWVQNRFFAKLAAMNKGIESEGSFYLFTLRLIPVFPFFVINLAMGMTKMPLFTFFWVSQIGMLPGTLVFVNAGRELAKIESLSGILSPGLILSFVILGIFPLTAKKLLGLYRKKFRPENSEGEDNG